MVYKMKSKKKTLKKVFKKKFNNISNNTKSLVSLIKKVSLRPTETKHTHEILENQQLNHNSPYVSIKGLYLSTSITDNNAGTSNFAARVGDEVIARGISYKFWFANKLDRPNVMFKIVFFKYQSSTTPSAPAPYYTQGTSNYMIRDLDTEKFKIVKVIKFTIQTSAQRIISQDTFQGAEAHKAISVWLPLKNQKIKYENDSTNPRFLDYGYNIVAYDSYGTQLTDNIASFAVNRKFYFKDP